MQPQNFQIDPGAVVLARDGFIGTVSEVLPAASAGQPGYFATEPNQNGDRLLIPLDLVDPQSQPGEVYLRDVFQNIIPRSINVPAGRTPQDVLSQGVSPVNQPAGVPNQDHMTVPVVEERLNVSKRPVELGDLEIRKTVDQVQDTRRLPLTFDQVDVEHVAVNRPLDAPLEPHYEGDVYVIPVMEEVLVIEKRLVLKEEIRIRKSQAVSEQQINETLRREHVEIVPPDNDHVTINDSTRAGTGPVAASRADDEVNEIIDGDLDPNPTDLPLTEQATMPNPGSGYRPIGYEPGRPPATPENTFRPNRPEEPV